MRARAGLLAQLLALLLVPALAAPAGAQGALGVRIREAALDPDGAVRVVVSVAGVAASQALDASSFQLSEQGKPVTSFSATPLVSSAIAPVQVSLAIDVSGSTQGQPLADAKAAAKAFLAGLSSNVRVQLIAFGPTASVRTPFTDDRALVSRTIDSLSAGGETTLYDAVALAAGSLRRTPGQHNIVLFSDGKDTVSKTTLDQASAAARGAGAPVTTVGLTTSDFDAAALKALATSTGGRLVTVGQSAGLAGAFAEVASEIASQYVLSYKATETGPKELRLSVSLVSAGATVADSIIVSNPRGALSAGGSVGSPALGGAGARAPKPLIGAFATKTGLWVGMGAVFAALALLFMMILVRPGERRVARALKRGIGLYSKRPSRETGSEGGFAGTAIGRGASRLIERVPKAGRYSERVQLSLDRAGWPLRATELLAIQILAAAGGLATGTILLGHWWLGIVLGALGAVAPKVVLKQRTDRRSALFVSQLPDTLQLLAGSLQAGYGFMQALDTLVRESPQPTAVEFSRVITEVRLGMSVEDSMTAMGERMSSEDFRWVVMAINIQRQVGGNLADLLQTVARTLREREQVRRQIKVLSAEGRLSAIILTVLPFAIAGWIMVVNPGYLTALFTKTLGRLMLVGALVFMGAGIAWMRKVVRIDV